MTGPTERVAVTQADRDAAADNYAARRLYVSAKCAREGRNDSDQLVQSFARHRLSASSGMEEIVGALAPTFSLAVTLCDGASDTQVNFQRDPKNWTNVRDAILIGIERLQGMIADQDGCPARPKDDRAALNRHRDTRGGEDA